MQPLIGSYVKYKNTVRLVTQLFAADSVRLLSPLLSGSNANVVVAIKNIEATNMRPAKVVNHGVSDYLVTAKGTIISLKTCKVMKWGKTDGTRISIMKLATLC